MADRRRFPATYSRSGWMDRYIATMEDRGISPRREPDRARAVLMAAHPGRAIEVDEYLRIVGASDA